MVQIVKAKNQVQGAFDFGKIQENKPVGFPHEGGTVKSLSNLFYWAHAWSEKGGLISEHPHQGFEIMSYVIRGEILHYDNKTNDWISLKAGDAQLIKSGNGITHAERFLPGSDIFQIWFDPNIRNSLNLPATYQDYPVDLFPVSKKANYTIKHIAGEKGIMNFDSEGMQINEYSAVNGMIDLQLNTDKINLFYAICGELKVGTEAFKRDDLLIVKDSESVVIEVLEKSKIFHVSIPKKLSYQSYAESQLI